jgi:nitrogen regulatory protein PII
MKTLEALVLTFNLDRVKRALHALGEYSMMLSEAPHVRRTGAAGLVVPAAFLPRIQVRVVVPDHVADRAAEILRRGA